MCSQLNYSAAGLLLEKGFSTQPLRGLGSELRGLLPGDALRDRPLTQAETSRGVMEVAWPRRDKAAPLLSHV